LVINFNNVPGTREEMLALQEKGLLWTVRHAYENCDFYRKKLDDAGVSPDDIRRLDDITRLPFTEKQDLILSEFMPLRGLQGKRRSPIIPARILMIGWK